MIWLIGLGLTWLTVLAFVFAFQRQLLYFPDRQSVMPSAFGLGDMRVVPVRTADGLMVSSWYRGPIEEGWPTVVILPGNAGHLGTRAPKARALLDAGYGVLLVGYRGFGGNPGSPSERGLMFDAHAAMDFLIGLGVGASRTVLYGESLGSAVALKLAVERRPAAIILEAPATSMMEVAALKVPLLPLKWLLLDRFDAKSLIGSVKAPLLLIHGERDTTVPVRLGRVLFALASEPKRAVWIANGGHNDLPRHGSMAIILEFLADHRPSP